jgi:hypothetical protein
MSREFARVVEEVDLVLAEAAELASVGPHFKIVHRTRELNSECSPGEEVAWALLVYRGREYLLNLSLSILLTFDYLARNRWLPQSARQIVAGMRVDPFYARHGADVRTDGKRTRKISRGAVKEYVKRIRRALEAAFGEAGLRLDPFSVLISETTEMNDIRYRLKASVEWVHRNYQQPVVSCDSIIRTKPRPEQ